MFITCLNPILKAGSAPSGIKLVAWLLGCWLLLAIPAYGRDVGEVSHWLSSHIFEGNGATLVLAKDGFFGLRLKTGAKRHRDFTGLWRLSSDGVELTLYNNQDAALKLTVGEIALHAILPHIGDATLIPVQTPYASFQIVGPLARIGKLTGLVDANSGKKFKVDAVNAADGKFATAEVEIGPAGVKTGRILTHSGSVPRYFQMPLATKGSARFLDAVVNRYWRLPPMEGIKVAALRFAPPSASGDKENIEGAFEISGPGLRLDGTYVLNNDKLTLKASRASIRNLALIGAEGLARAFIGELSWRLAPGGLQLRGRSPMLLTAVNS